MTQEISLGQKLVQYFHILENSDKSASVIPTKSAFIRIVVPALGGPVPAGKRAKEFEVAQALDFLNQIPQSKVSIILDQVDTWSLSQENTSKLSRGDKSRIRAFVKWVAQDNTGEVEIKDCLSSNTIQLSSGTLEPTVTTNDSNNGRRSLHRFRTHNPRFRSPVGTRRKYAKNLNLRGKTRTKAYSLGCKQFNDYVLDEKGQQVLGNAELQSDFDGLAAYQQDKLKMRLPSVKKNFDHLRSFYGWLHRHKGVPLSELSFRKQIPVFQLYSPLEECLDETGSPSFHVRAVKEAIAKDRAKAAARQLVDLFREFLDFMNGAASSDCAYVGAMLNAAKYLYHEVTDKEQYDDFQDISFVLQLRLLRRERDNSSEPVVPREKKSLPWPEILKVMEQLRTEADLEYLEGYYGPKKQTLVRVPRKDLWRAKSYLKFLIVAFFCIIPPQRSRTIQELEIGETMLKGAMVDGEFIAAEFLSNPSEAGWWLYLPPEKSKTGGKYGPYWSELPNVQFKDGKYIYEYIDEWLNKYRKCFPTNHNYFFTRHGGGPVTPQSLWEYVRDFFMRITEVPVSPKEFRASFVTYLYDIGLPDYELDAVAFSMLHTRRMQESHYRKQQQLKRTQVAVNRSVEIINTILGIQQSNDNKFHQTHDG